MESFRPRRAERRNRARFPIFARGIALAVLPGMHDDTSLTVSTSATITTTPTTTEADPSGDWPTLDVLRLRYIHRAIEHMNNNKTRAAELLGIDRRTLNRILARERARRRAAAEAGAH